MRYLPLVIIAATLPGFAFAAGPQAGSYSGSVQLGGNFFGSGKLHGAATTTIPSLTALNPGLPAVPADLTIESRKFSDVYDDPVQFGIEGAYGLSDDIELFAGFNYSKAEGGRVQVGNATVAALNATLPTFGQFDDLTATNFEAGARYFFAGEQFRPFVGASLGATQQDAVKASFTIPDAPAGGITLTDVPFFKKTTAVNYGVEGGLAFGFSDTVDARFSVGARYTGAAKGDDTGLSGLGLATINNGSERWNYPVKASVAFRF
jgi:hypothetical protein